MNNNDRYLLQHGSEGNWRTVGKSSNFGVLYRELHSNRQHPHSDLQIIESDTQNVIMRCWDNGFIEPFKYGQYTHLTSWDADFDP